MSEKLTEAFGVLMDRVVNPTCDECGISLNLRGRNHWGAHLCVVCQQRGRLEMRARHADAMSQERPDRKIHTVKLPEAMQREFAAGRAAISREDGER
ncbi:hypothetical protein [Aureimonas sp. AU20]|uniref:hypothetical protein n=1 Tax=Aureimonas sp. AU20 TaxID=1349819 RepID=UPI00071EA1E7|nr:hypothetical protein [Aureimonas sp. AU20]ALN73571.1 hypothetical protein M673_12655 [Aureimonas sp. AU20]